MLWVWAFVVGLDAMSIAQGEPVGIVCFSLVAWRLWPRRVA